MIISFRYTWKIYRDKNVRFFYFFSVKEKEYKITPDLFVFIKKKKLIYTSNK